MFSEKEKLSLVYQRQQAGDRRAKALILKEIEDDAKKLFGQETTEKINPKDIVIQSVVVFPDGTSKEIVQFADGTSQEKIL